MCEPCYTHEQTNQPTNQNKDLSNGWRAMRTRLWEQIPRKRKPISDKESPTQKPPILACKHRMLLSNPVWAQTNININYNNNNNCPRAKPMSDVPTYRNLKETISLSSLPQMRTSKKREREREWEKVLVVVDSKWPTQQSQSERKRQRNIS